MRAPRIRAFVIACVAALSGCKEEGAPSGASSAAVSAAPPASARPQLGPVEACLAATEQEVSSTDPSGKGGRISRACAPLYKEPACRQAHEKFDEPEVKTRAVVLARACKDAYCPKLPDPKPKLCSQNVDDVKPNELGYAWWDLRTAIWKMDLGEPEAKRLEREMLRLAAQQK